MIFKKNFLFSIVFVMIAIIVCFTANAQEVPKAEIPLLITSAGQSPDFNVVGVLCGRYNIKATSKGLATVEDLDNMKSIIFVMGGSTKGLGSAGIDEDQELERLTLLLEKAVEQNMAIIGIHIGGEGRRGPLSMKYIEPISPKCDYLIVTEDGNKDGYFTDLGEEFNIPTFVIEKSVELGPILAESFKDNE